MKKFGGSIFVDSVINKGTEFLIFFPKAHLGNQKLAEKQKQVKSGNGTILIVEDSIPLLKLAQNMLNSLGYETLTADNGKDAINIAKNYKNRIDLIFSDLVMPNSTGVDIYNQILKIIPDIKVLYTSGYDDKFLKTHNIQITDNNFIHKPIDINKISNMISKLLN